MPKEPKEGCAACVTTRGVFRTEQAKSSGRCLGNLGDAGRELFEMRLRLVLAESQPAEGSGEHLELSGRAHEGKATSKGADPRPRWGREATASRPLQLSGFAWWCFNLLVAIANIRE